VARFPGNKRFAFSVFDDTDRSTVENVEPVYQFLSDLAIRTTKSVWPLANKPSARIDGSTLQDRNYLDFVLRLQKEGFEIGLHNVRNYDATRDIVQRGLEQFHTLLGTHPVTHCNHDRNRENLYWGPSRFVTAAIRVAYNLSTRFSYRDSFEGHLENSPYFWGDICQNRISYVRNFVFDEINLDRINPTLPYYDPSRPFVNFWFSSTDGGTVESFCHRLCEANQDRLEAEGGVCIMYTHFAAGFWQNGQLHPTFERLIRRLAKMNGWFVPVATLLDHLRKSQEGSAIPKKELANMERRWFFSKLRKGTT
jgi:hypothetical protein